LVFVLTNIILIIGNILPKIQLKNSKIIAQAFLGQKSSDKQKRRRKLIGSILFMWRTHLINNVISRAK